ncbi:MAG TPA: hypothetical protein VHK01_14335 [Lacipirellulaceae bacterium]|nr:hypothetical protein [Lacipirellulaceae bacterium]
MKNLLAMCVWCMAVVAPTAAADIAWVTFHGADDTGNTPSNNAANVGFTTAPDKGYTDLLTAVGHTINRVTVPAAAANAALSTAMLAELNAADLVVIGRSVNSGSFEQAAETMSWNNSITKPLLLTSGFITRANRLGFITADDVDDINGPTRLVAANPLHPVFNGITLNASNETGTILDLVTVPINGNPTAQRGTSINTDPLVVGATLIASVTDDNTNTEVRGQPVIAEWPAGTPTANAGETFAGRRMIFITGSREVDGITGDSAGIMDLSTDGQQMFINTVCYLTGEGCLVLVPGDTDGDGIVELTDFDPIRANFRNAVSSRAQGDLVPNGRVDFDDFRQWKTAFTGAGGSLAGVDLGFGANVPEPSSAAAASSGLLGLLMAIRRRFASHVRE